MIFIWLVVVGAALAGCFFDLRARRIPNRLTGVVLASGLAWRGVVDGWGGLGDALLGALCLATPFILLYCVARGGAGDAKLMMGLGAWLGVHQGLCLLCAVLLLGAVLGLLFCLLKGQGRAVGQRLGQMLLWLPYVALGKGQLGDRATVMPSASQMVIMPYGPAIFLGSVVAALGVNLGLF